MFFINWWNSLSIASQIFTCIAVPSTVLLIIQTVTMLLGFDSDDLDGPDLDADVDLDEVDADPSGLDGLRIFTLRGIVAFLVVFGWVGIVLDSLELMLPLTILIAALCGALMMFILALLLRSVMKLRSEGNIDNRNAIGKSGRVYLTIPANRSGEGKVEILIQGALKEMNAVTDENESINTGSEIIVTGVSGQTTLVVKKK